jgi:CheY-like chemotaxis protein
MKRTLLLEHASAVLIERPMATRRLLRTALHNIGLREMRELDQMPDPGTDLLQSVDLVLVDLTEEDRTGAQLVANIRRRIAAFNPFIATIATSFSAEAAIIRSAVDAGTDGILLKPFSQQQVYEQVLRLIEQRRPFVVTANYIGPERRPAQRRGGGIASIDVPNTLRDKLLQGRGFRAADSAARVDAAWGRVSREFGLRGAFQILYLIRLAKAAIDDPAQADTGQELARLREAAKELLSRIAETQLRDIAAELTDWVTHRLDMRSGEANAVALDKVTELTTTLLSLLGSDVPPRTLIQQADRAAVEYRARQFAQLANANVGS